jgi:C4-type Zn-finger protein
MSDKQYSRYGNCICPVCSTINQWRSDFKYSADDKVYMLNHICKKCNARRDQLIVAITDENFELLKDVSL